MLVRIAHIFVFLTLGVELKAETDSPPVFNFCDYWIEETWQAVENGDTDAQRELASMYAEGLCLSKDVQAAKYWYVESVKSPKIGIAHHAEVTAFLKQIGASAAMCDLLNRTLAAAEQGSPNAQHNAARMYEQGLCVPLSLARAEFWYRLASRHGIYHEFKLAEFLKRAGEEEKSITLLRRLAKQDHRLSQIALGDAYSVGSGVIQHFTLAHMWYNIASRNQVGWRLVKIEDLEEKMTKEQVATAQELARRCVASEFSKCAIDDGLDK